MYVALRRVGVGQSGQHGGRGQHQGGLTPAGLQKILQGPLQDVLLLGRIHIRHFRKIHVQAGQLSLPGRIALAVERPQQGGQIGVGQVLPQLQMPKAVASGKGAASAGGLARREARGPDHARKAQAGQHRVIVVPRGIGLQQGTDVIHGHAGAELVQGADRPAEFAGQQALCIAVDMP